MLKQTINWHYSLPSHNTFLCWLFVENWKFWNSMPWKGMLRFDNKYQHLYHIIIIAISTVSCNKWKVEWQIIFFKFYFSTCQVIFFREKQVREKIGTIFKDCLKFSYENSLWHARQTSGIFLCAKLGCNLSCSRLVVLIFVNLKWREEFFVLLSWHISC